jgi:hypothetical protein
MSDETEPTREDELRVVLEALCVLRYADPRPQRWWKP